MKAFVVTNRLAGNLRAEAVARDVDRRLRAAGLAVSHVPVSRVETAAETLREMIGREAADQVRVVVAGGDGTINAALPALAGTAVPMAILPLGSVNVLARELGVPRNLSAAVAVAAAGRPRQIDLGVVNGRPFALMAGIGFDAAVVHSVSPRIKKVIGSIAYLERGLRLLADRSASRFRVTTESGEVRADAWLAVIANASRYTYDIRLAPEARIDDGWLDLRLFQRGPVAQTISQVMAVLRGRHLDRPGITHLRARRLRLECDPPVRVQVDGDAMGLTPAEVTILPGALTVLVPQ